MTSDREDTEKGTAERLQLQTAISAGTQRMEGLLRQQIVTELRLADVRAAYPEALTGRAMAVFTMAMFLGIALMQWITGVVASVAGAHQVETFTAVLATVAALLAAGALAFAALPSAHLR